MSRRTIFSCFFFVVSSFAAAVADEFWSPNPAVAVFDGPDYSGKNDDKCVVRIVATRNGSFTGQVVTYSKTPAKHEAARISDLKTTDGATIPAAAIKIFYALPNGSETGGPQRFPGVKSLRRLDALSPTPPDEPMTSRAVWIKVKVPGDAKPGVYQGELTVGSHKAAVRLSVADWKLPDPIDFETWVGLLQSADSVAMKYNAELFSDRHFDLVGKTFDCLAEVGNKIVIIPVICKTHFGNEQGMVRWIKDGNGFKYDFTPAEKYLDLYIKHVGKPKVVCFYVWEKFCGSNYFGKEAAKPAATPVSLLDWKTGKVEMFDGPVLGSSDSETFFKPVLDGLREMLAKRGLGDETFMIGMAGDMRPNKDCTAMFKKIAPYARWVLQSHGKATDLNGVPVGYLTHVWGVGAVPDPDAPPKQSFLKNYYYGWNQKLPICVFPREGGTDFVIQPPLWATAPLGVHRELPEGCLAVNLRGLGRVGADFWPVAGAGNKAATLLNRYLESNLAQLTVSTAQEAILHPGPNGAISTARFENLREGVQECEAKIAIEKALLDKTARAALGDAAAKSEEMLKERLRVFRKSLPGGKGQDGNKGWEWFSGESGWQDRTEQLFQAAGGMTKQK